MNIINLLIVNTAITLLYFDVLHLNYYLKKWLGYNTAIHKKPFDCYFCITMWIGIVITIINLIVTKDYKQTLLLLSGVFVTSKIIDKLWN